MWQCCCANKRDKLDDPKFDSPIKKKMEQPPPTPSNKDELRDFVPDLSQQIVEFKVIEKQKRTEIKTENS